MRKKQKRRNENYGVLCSIVWAFLSLFLSCLLFIEGKNIWNFLRGLFLGFFGIQAVFVPAAIIFSIFVYATGNKDKKRKLIFLMLLIILINLFISVVVTKDEKLSRDLIKRVYFMGLSGTGVIGTFLGFLLVLAFGKSGAEAFLFISSIFVLMLNFEFNFVNLITYIGSFFKKLRLKFVGIPLLFNQKCDSKGNQVEVINTKSLERLNQSFKGNEINFKEGPENFGEDGQDIAKVTAAFMEKFRAEKKLTEPVTKNANGNSLLDANNGLYRYPPSDLLTEPVNPEQKDIASELNVNGKMLIDTLSSFNVLAKIVDISRGPAVTRYEIQPASGVKVSKITNLADDIALNLAALGVRIEAPIPGKSAVGVEIPNRVVSIVGIREIIESQEFLKSTSPLSVVLGRNIAGSPIVTDLGKMPHLLIAGSTGAGKSVCVNSFIVSILYKSSPAQVKLLMIDPKVVELGVYNGIPHLLVPVVTDPRKSAGALNWAVNEMLSRYKIFAEIGVRDIASHNAFLEKNKDFLDKDGNLFKKMARIVIVIDELSDLMMAAPNEIEDYICRLTQMARAAGMHLVIATQRPSVDVITGVIKANVPSRIALAVSSQVDSRTILDMSGAEKLLGRGDMLFSPIGSIKPQRVQGCYVTDSEIERVVAYVKNTDECNYDSSIIEGIERGAAEGKDALLDSESEENGDPIMKDAIKCVIEVGQASTSLLQRRLRLGYARAGRLIDEMEQMGIVGPHEGSKSRRVLMSYQEFLEKSLRERQ